MEIKFKIKIIRVRKEKPQAPETTEMTGDQHTLDCIKADDVKYGAVVITTRGGWLALYPHAVRLVEYARWTCLDNE